MNLERKTGLFCLAMTVILFSAFIYKGAIRNHILEWDDQVYVRDNPHIKALSIDNIKSILTKPYFKNYTPIHLLSYLFDHIFWGDNYSGYHLTNLLIHILNLLLDTGYGPGIIRFLRTISYRPGRTLKKHLSWLKRRSPSMLLMDFHILYWGISIC